MFGDVVLGLSKEEFENKLEAMKEAKVRWCVRLRGRGGGSVVCCFHSCYTLDIRLICSSVGYRCAIR